MGPYRESLPTECGDFLLRRSDGLFAYQLAVVVDDAAMGVTQVVRGSDLLSSTPRQILLYRLLELPEPKFYHLPLLLQCGGTAPFQTGRSTLHGCAAVQMETRGNRRETGLSCWIDSFSGTPDTEKPADGVCME